jgi:thiol-disulfide isomerase/thioredoxin
MFRRIIVGIVFSFFLLFASQAWALEEESPSKEKTITVFVRDGCPKCEEEEDFLNSISEQNPSFAIQYINIYEGPENKKLFDRFVDTIGLGKITPITLVGKQVFQGFESPETTGKFIIDAIQKNEVLLKEDLEYVFEAPQNIEIAGTFEGCDENDDECKLPENSLLSSVRIPFLGTYDLRGVSLFSLASILGLLDGFNPCAMWVLIIFILTLVQIGDRLKMAFVAGTFLIAQAIMYTLIIVSWWKFFDFAGNAPIITMAIGILAIGAGGFFLWEGVFTDGTCKVTTGTQRKKIKDRITEIATSPISILSFFGILGLAFSVNIIEFACSAGYPQVFTNVLSASSFSLFEKILAITVYILFYMIDDMIVFFIALYSIEKIGITHKFSRASNIIGGLIMLLIGILMIVKPDLLSL